jgi:Cell wall-active antibiotics response LiaF, C-terminal
VLGELAELTTDLERPPDPAAAAPDQMTAILSSDARDGHWRVPAQLSAHSPMGECKIDMQDAVLTSHTTVIEARAMLGSVEIFVPDGVEVRLTGKAILGEKSPTVRQAPVPGAPVVEVRATAILGSVKVRPPKLSKRIGAVLRQIALASLQPNEDDEPRS